jgi:creatinine amidohydrolase
MRKERAMAREFARLTAMQIGLLPRDKTVFFFGVGPLEDHGPHLPVDLDVLEAEHLCREAAERLERELPGWVGIVMPSLPLGIESNTSAIRITVRPHVLRDWLVDSCRSLGAAGFRQFVCFSGHLGPKQLTAIEEAGKIVSKPLRSAGVFRKLGFFGSRSTLVSASSALVTAADVRASPFRLDPPEHGGTRDTSAALALGVPLSPQFKDLPPQARVGSFLSRLFQYRTGKLSGYWGSPGLGDAQVGGSLLKGSLDEIFPKLRAVWEGSNPNALFRSWYSILPFHKSFFRAWVLALAFAGLICFWIFLNVQAMISS